MPENKLMVIMLALALTFTLRLSWLIKTLIFDCEFIDCSQTNANYLLNKRGFYEGC